MSLEVDRLIALEDREEIRELITRYGPLADCGDAAGVAALWWPDGVYAIAGFDEAKGHAAIAALIEGPEHQALMADGCAHILGPVSIDLLGEEAVARGHSLVVRRKASGFEIYRASANRWKLKKGPQGWRVVRRDNAVLDGTTVARSLLSGSSD